ncbi:MAG: CHAT domain-containing protein [Bacteroidia bacterium]|nr:CHAT domain-containing protein [Bacteroidia bacterium]
MSKESTQIKAADTYMLRLWKLWGAGMGFLLVLILFMTISGAGPFEGKISLTWMMTGILALPLLGLFFGQKLLADGRFTFNEQVFKISYIGSLLYIVLCLIVYLGTPFFSTMGQIPPIQVIQNALLGLLPLQSLIWFSFWLLFYKKRELLINQKILFLSANPKQTDQLRIGEEVRKISTGLKQAKYREQFELKQEWAVTVDTLQQSLLDEKPEFVHFSGHGGSLDQQLSGGFRSLDFGDEGAPEDESGLALEEENGKLKFVKTQALSNLFKLFSGEVKCVLLNACYSEVQAEAIVEHIPYVIGMKSSIPDSAAIAFSVGFYKALGAGESIPFAFDMGKNSIQLQDLNGADLPVLLEKNPASK